MFKAYSEIYTFLNRSLLSSFLISKVSCINLRFSDFDCWLFVFEIISDRTSSSKYPDKNSTFYELQEVGKVSFKFEWFRTIWIHSNNFPIPNDFSNSIYFANSPELGWNRIWSLRDLFNDITDGLWTSCSVYEETFISFQQFLTAVLPTMTQFVTQWQKLSENTHFYQLEHPLRSNEFNLKLVFKYRQIVYGP